MSTDTDPRRHLPPDEEYQPADLQPGGEPHHQDTKQIGRQLQPHHRVESVQQPDLSPAHRDDQLLPVGED